MLASCGLALASSEDGLGKELGMAGAEDLLGHYDSEVQAAALSLLEKTLPAAEDSELASQYLGLVLDKCCDSPSRSVRSAAFAVTKECFLKFRSSEPKCEAFDKSVAVLCRLLGDSDGAVSSEVSASVLVRS